VEGLAVALELPRGQWTLHQWTRAARDLGFMPDLAGALGPAGFWKAAPARAYGAAGSFLGFLRERHGAAPVAALYRSGDFVAAFGRPVEALVTDWQAFLDTQPVPRGLRTAAQARYARPPMFQVPCAREVAALEAQAWHAAGAGRTAEACRDLRRVASLTGRASALRGVGDLLARAGDLDGAEAAYREAMPVVPEADGLQKALLVAAVADLHWRRDEPGAAAAGYWEALAVQPDRPEARLLEAKLTALADRTLAVEARPWLLGLEPQPAALARLERLDHPLASYLRARVLLSRGEAAAALPLLEAAAAGRLPPVLRDEASFLLGEARCDAGHLEAGRALLASLARAAAPVDAPEGSTLVEADRLRAEAGVRRCDFQAEPRARGAAQAPAGAAAAPISAPAAGR
jgi:tetratricopeptide (TPR) repeat protein